MLYVPCILPVTIPELDPTLATVPLSLAHVPPVVRSLSDTVDPVQTLFGPNTTKGSGLTVTIVVM